MLFTFHRLDARCLGSAWLVPAIGKLIYLIPLVRRIFATGPNLGLWTKGAITRHDVIAICVLFAALAHPPWGSGRESDRSTEAVGRGCVVVVVIWEERVCSGGWGVSNVTSKCRASPPTDLGARLGPVELRGIVLHEPAVGLAVLPWAAELAMRVDGRQVA